MTKSGLRGRGGAGFPTGLKWSTVAKAQNKQKYVICNADEGDPGAFMDRSVLESDPHRVLEGMAIAAYATGANQRLHLLPRGISAGGEAAEDCHQAGREHRRAGQGIMGTTFNFNVEVRLGAGAFVCGEETALIHSIEGKRGTPRPRPPFPASRACWDCPTLINNVETFANVPPILRKGGEWFASHRHREEQGHQGVRPRRPREQHRPDRSAHGHQAPRDHLLAGRRHSRRPQVQGGADRRPLRRLHPRAVPGYGSGLRLASPRSARSWAPAA